MALVNDDEVKEIRGILPEIWRRLAIFRRAAHEGLEDGEEQAGILRDLAFLADVLRTDAGHGVLRERGEGVIGLVGKDIAVSQEEDARAAR